MPIPFKTAALLCALALSGWTAKPNVILFLVDDLGYKDATFMGSHYYETPNMDSLAASGMRFTNGYANASNCAPTRAALISGQYAPRTGVYTVNNSDRGLSKNRVLIPEPNTEILAADNFTIGDAMKSAGYATALIGKWNLGSNANGPKAHGFDVNIGGTDAGQPPSYFSPYGNPQLPDGPNGEYLTDRLTVEANKFIEAHKDVPFFIDFAHFAVHEPLQAKQGKVNHYKTKTGSDGQNNPTYAAMIESADESLGSLVAKLKQLNLLENTLIILTSDNGGHGGITAQLPLRGAKGDYYEGGIRVPWVWSWAGKIARGSVSNAPIMSFDIYPTIAKLGGAALPAEKQLDGLDIAPILFNTGSISRDALYFHFPAYLDTYDTSLNPIWRTTPVSAILSGDYKFLEYYEYGQLELYNLKDDISETHNLALSLPNKTKELRDKLHAWISEYHAPVPTEHNPGFQATSANNPGSYVTWAQVSPLVTGISQVAPPQASGFSMVKSGGNQVRFSFVLKSRQKVELALFDSHGRQLQPRMSKILPQGPQTLAMEIPSQRMFVSVLKIGSQQFAKKYVAY